MDSSATGTAILVKDLGKTYRRQRKRPGIQGALIDMFVPRSEEFPAVADISFEVASGEIVGFVGPNGAGKSTIIKMLSGILQPSRGSLNVLGFVPFRDRTEYTRHISTMFGQRSQLWWDIPVSESLRLCSRIYRMDEAHYRQSLAMLTEVLQLEDVLDLPARSLSLGQRVKSDLACSLLHQPRLLFLDEPAIGLDVLTKESLRKFLRGLHQKLGTTILLTTHDLREVEQLCKRIFLIDKGRLLFNGSLDRLREMSSVRRKILLKFTSDIDVTKLANLLPGQVEFEKTDLCCVQGVFDINSISAVEIMEKVGRHFELRDCLSSDPELEEIILKVCQHGL